MDDRTTASTPDNAAAPDKDPLSGVQSAREAALTLGVSERTIRRAIQRGELVATKRAGVFHITLAALEVYRQREVERRSKSGAAAEEAPSSSAAAADSGQPSDDAVVVLRHLLAEERARSDRLLEAATLWQARAMQLEERVKALEAGPISVSAPAEADVPPQPPPEPEESPPPTAVSLGLAWRRWFRRLLGQP